MSPLRDPPVVDADGFVQPHPYEYGTTVRYAAVFPVPTVFRRR